MPVEGPAAACAMTNFGFIPVSLSTLYPTDGLGLDLYVRPLGYERPVLFCGSNLPLHQGDLCRLEESGITKLYIRREARQQYQDFLRENLDNWLSSADLPMATRAGALNEVVRDVLSESFKNGVADSIVGHARELGQHAANLLGSEPLLFRDFVRVLHHDYATFTHSANVCYYAVLLAGAIGLGEDDRKLIATGGLLHDLGKLDIDDRILTKDGRLEEVESRQIRKHPLTGFRKLAHRSDLCAGQLLMVYQHHERVDGSGYPVGAVAGEIHPWAQICTVVDVFEALTSQRPYRRPLSHETALEVMSRECARTFDPELLTCWTRLVQSHSTT